MFSFISEEKNIYFSLISPLFSSILEEEKKKVILSSHLIVKYYVNNLFDEPLLYYIFYFMNIEEKVLYCVLFNNRNLIVVPLYVLSFS